MTNKTKGLFLMGLAVASFLYIFAANYVRIKTAFVSANPLDPNLLRFFAISLLSVSTWMSGSMLVKGVKHQDWKSTVFIVAFLVLHSIALILGADPIFTIGVGMEISGAMILALVYLAGIFINRVPKPKQV